MNIPTLAPHNDGRHELGDLPLGRESVPYIVSLPDIGIGIALYTWVNTEHRAGAMFGVFGPGVKDGPIIEAIDDIEMGAGDNFDQWQVGPVTLQHDLQLKNAKFSAKTARCEVHASFSAMHDAYAYGFHPDGCPHYAATDRIEQSGAIEGYLVLDGTRHDFATTGARDHSWGMRDWLYAQHWKWLHAQTKDTAVHFWKIDVAGRTDLRGYLHRDGRTVEVASADVTMEYDEGFQHRKVLAEVTDREGRTAKVSGDYFGHFEFDPHPECVLLEGAMSCEIDGQTAVGWTEVMWPKGYLEYLRSV